MPSPSSTEQSIVIVLAILRCIPKNSMVSTRDILNHLHNDGITISLRTVQRYLTLLCDHYDIEKKDDSKPYGYRWKPHTYRFDVPHLTDQQAILLLLTKKHLEKLLPQNLLNSVMSLFDRANFQLQHEPKSVLGKEWLDKVCVVPTSQPLLPAAIDGEILSTVSSALYHNKTLHIEYENQLGKSHTADVNPLGLAQQGGNLYLVVHYPKFRNSAARNLAMHRIKSAQETPFSFERPHDFDLEHYQNSGHFAWGQGKKIHLSFVIRKSEGFHLTETPLSLDQTISDYSDSQYLVQATVFDSEMLDWWLGTFKDAVSMVEKKLLE